MNPALWIGAGGLTLIALIAAATAAARAITETLTTAYERLDANLEDALDDPWDRDLRQLLNTD